MVVNNCWLILCFTYWYFISNPPPHFEVYANLNQNQFPLDFLHTFTVILPSVTGTLDNSNLLLTWITILCFPSDPFYTINFILQLHNSNHVLIWKNIVNCSLKHWISQLQQKHDTCIPSPPYFLTSGYLLRTPNDSNCFQFPLNVQVIASQLYKKIIIRDWSSILWIIPWHML